MKIFENIMLSCFIFSRVSITFVNPDGDKMEAKAKVGDNLLDVILENNVDIDGFGKINNFYKVENK